ncbi:hypothetical protein CEUSTIGMA_g7269.t1 [Chlamydomonas eustigma]|uniref:Phosphatidic acid phosphatase type 2/haloperoxidase domain-containing protein n=1 Tax=Chlamydomonas eustigma TaxID=1157962 RepID=A0A250XAA4_9CHLO|nr:hypothetical protein CEUSTIGMA_g7269.t1 [Chlamydomonas eustigma]|eukprot:GAX79829.1 hypothetical protein CEUSTIGMA_g7269.t1 [Chlamydomonas eustigma]
MHNVPSDLLTLSGSTSIRSRKRSGTSLEIEVEMPNHSDNIPGTDEGTEELKSYHAVRPESSNHPAWLLHMKKYSGYYGDGLAMVLCLIIYASLEAGSPKLTFIPNSYLSYYSYPLKSQTVPSWSVPLYAAGLPLLCFSVIVLLGGKQRVELYRMILALATSMLLTGAITNSLKLAISRPRPNFIVSCWPNGGLVWESGNSTFGGYPVCSTNVKLYGEHLKSFPSGHSSMSASGLGLLTYYLLGQTRAFAGDGHSWHLVVSLVPALLAVAVGVTRITDCWHHTSDVLTGLALGFGISFELYRQIFPSLTHPKCNTMTSELKSSQKPTSTTTSQQLQQPVGPDQEALLHSYQFREARNYGDVQEGLPV